VTLNVDPFIFVLVFSSLAMAQKLVRTLHDRLKIIEEIENNPGEKRVDIAKLLRLPASTLNTIFAMKNC
jgi:ubiquinone biosynthesis protein Coq4